MDYKIHQTTSPLPLIELYNPYANTWLVRWQGIKEGEMVEAIVEGKPTLEEIKHIIVEWHSKQVDEAILSGHRYEGHLVWLSRENQINYKAAYDLAFQLKGTMGTLPVTFKLGSDDEPHYKTFETLEELTNFYLSTVNYIQSCYTEGWHRREAIVYAPYEEALQTLKNPIYENTTI